MPEYTFLTGATGLLGSFLMRDLLASGQPLAVLVRSTNRQTAAERVDRVVADWESRWGGAIPRPVYLEGDVNHRHLGMDAATRRWVARYCRRVIHNAAVLKFVGNNRDEDPWQTNLDGTGRVLAFCRELGLREFHYVSTAYVCGTREGTIFEHELDRGQTFRNDYEQSKCLAEKLVRDDSFIDRPTIYRPAVIVGDSATGMTTTYHGVFAYLRVLATLIKKIPADRQGIRKIPLRVAMNGNERRNLVPVDWVSNAIRHLADLPEARGQTFHLAPPVATTTQQLYEAAFRYFRCEGLEFCGTDWQHGPHSTRLERAFLSHSALYRDYELTDPVFDTSHFDRVAGHLPCPTIDEATVRRFCAYGEQDGWGTGIALPSVSSLPKHDVLASTTLPL